jgi:hypothetical protein
MVASPVETDSGDKGADRGGLGPDVKSEVVRNEKIARPVTLASDVAN